LFEWKGCDVEELSVQPDHIHMVVSIPPKMSVSELIGVVKGKLAIKLFKSYPQLKKNPYWGNHFWSRGYFVKTFQRAISRLCLQNNTKFSCSAGGGLICEFL